MTLVAKTVLLGTRTVYGRIQRCSGLPEPMRYVGGTVVALRSVVRWRKVSKGLWHELLPTDVVGCDVVPKGGEYRFALVPGNYVIDLSHYIGGNVGSQVSVVIRGGRTIRADLPNDCK